MHILSRRKLVVGLVALVLVLVLGAGASLLFRSTETAAGPLNPHYRPGHWYRIGGRMLPGSLYAFQAAFVENHTNVRAVLVKIVPVGLPAGVRLVKTFVMLHGPYLGSESYPLTNPVLRNIPTRPLAGTVVPPGTTKKPGIVEIVAVVTPAHSGVFLTRGVRVYYRVAGTEYSYFEPAQWALCVQPARCPGWA